MENKSRKMTTTEMTIFLNDPESQIENFKNNENIKILKRFVVDNILNTKNLFVFTSLKELLKEFAKINSILEKANDRGNLRGFLIRSDIDATPIIPQLFEHKNSEFSPILHSNSVAIIRKQYKLRQVDIQGISEKQVRRIEQGKSQKLSALQQLAQAHQTIARGSLTRFKSKLNKVSTQLPIPPLTFFPLSPDNGSL